MSQKIVTVDAFTDTPFAGNPAAVCLTPGPVDDGWMKRLAREMNLSETAFLHPVADGFSLRWLTPAIEVDLCGHATLASAHVLWEDGVVAADATIRFQTRSGTLTATRDAEGWITLDFPAKPVTRPAQRTESEAIESVLGTPIVSAWMSAFDMLVELGSEAAVRELRPDFTRLKRFAVRGLIASSRASTPGFDFVSRFFAPAVGVDEDPVTGSAHCVLGPFWADRFDKTDFLAYQASERGGWVRVSVRGDRVLLGGQAVTVLRAGLSTGASPPRPG
jgi:PhzF family phenazine biosynthesis protein